MAKVSEFVVVQETARFLFDNNKELLELKVKELDTNEISVYKKENVSIIHTDYGSFERVK